MRMPEMDGIEATKKIRTLPGGQDVKIIALTASAFFEQRQEFLDAGCEELIPKPFLESEIFQAMKLHLGVRFIYDEPQKKSELEDVSPLIQGSFSKIPIQLMRSFREALSSLNQEEIAVVIAKISAREASLANSLTLLVKDFQYAKIIKQLDKDLASKEKSKKQDIP